MAAAILPLALGVGGSLLAGALMPKPQAPAATAQAPKVMPLADDQAVADAKRRSMMAQMQRGGRTSTMLSSDSDTLGAS